LPHDKPPRESIFCSKMSGWLRKRALLVLKFSLKSLQGLTS